MGRLFSFACVLGLWAVQAATFHDRGGGGKPPRQLGRALDNRKLGGGRDAEEALSEEELRCGVITVARADSDKKQWCPESCPLFAQDRSDDRHCTFQCVAEDKCPLMNPNKPIPDKKMGVCRSPMVEYCRDPMLDGSERCKICMSGYALHTDGQCYYKYMFLIYMLVAILALLVVVVVCWIVDLVCRPATNEKGVEEGLRAREKSKVLKRQHVVVEGTPRSPRSPGDRRPSARIGFASQSSHRLEEAPYPLSTNLCSEDVAGPGMTLHFNFQVAIIVWALMMAAGWAALGFLVDGTLFVLGTRKFGTPRENCIVVAWGFEAQQRLMWTKVLYLWVAYLSSFALALLHSVRQLRLYQRMDSTYKTMRDFAAMIAGLPECDGSMKIEDMLKKQLKDQLSMDIVGVSVAWNFKAKEEDVTKATKLEWLKASKSSSRYSPVEDDDNEASQAGPIRKRLSEFENSLLISEPEEVSEGEIQQLLGDMKTSGNAFVVFRTEADRDAALEKQDVVFEGSTIQLSHVHCEPTTVQWVNFDGSGAAKKTARLLKGVGYILLALLVWCMLFYGPYAWSIFNFNYDNGMQPGFIYGFAFSMVVVVGNAMMYQACSWVSEMVGFRFRDDMEASYLIMYTGACTLNVLLDLMTTYFMSWSIMSGLGFRTYDGTRLENVSMFPQGFETYAMQRNLAESTYAYAWPSTYLIPFLIEPLATVTMPLYLGKLLVRSNRKVTGSDAEDLLLGLPMDLGRYGDILLDVVLFIIILYFPGGYTAHLAFFLALSHIYIYAFDSYKVLRVIPSCTYASFVVDWWSQAMLAPCCGLILSVLVFKSNTDESGGLGALSTVAACSAAFVLHCVVHLLLLVYVVPMCGEEHEDLVDEVTFQDVAKTCPSSWFNTNPVHCLRSKFVYGHSPPCRLFSSQKQYLLEKNEAIGCYFEGSEDANVKKV